QSAEIHDSLAAAVAGSGLVVGATRRGGQDRHPLLGPDEWIRDYLPRADGHDVSIVFGCEKDGLSREELDRCDLLLALPANPEYGSYNLAAAVLLVGYELFRSSPSVPQRREKADLTSRQEREDFFAHLEQVLLEVGFLHPNNPGRIMTTL